MKRRALVSALGTGLASLSGCVAPTSTRDTTTARTSDHDTSTTSPSLQDTSTAPTQDTTSSTPSETPAESCAPSGNVSLESESDRFVAVTTDDDTVSTHVFTLSNGMDCPLEVNPRDWEIEVETTDGWEPAEGLERVVGGNGDEPRTLERGEEHRWSLSLTDHPTPYTETTTYVFHDLSEGTHRFSIAGRTAEGRTVTRQVRFEVVKRTGTTTGNGT